MQTFIRFADVEHHTVGSTWIVTHSLHFEASLLFSDYSHAPKYASGLHLDSDLLFIVARLQPSDERTRRIWFVSDLESVFNS